MRTALVILLALLSGSDTYADNTLASYSTTAPCGPQDSGPAILVDLPLYKEGHPGTRVIDYGLRLPPDEFQPAVGIECRVLPDTAPVAQWIARPPPKGQVAGSIPARGTN
jgi:hypothetical protein